MLSKKLALITGAASGIGLDVAKLFSKQGATIIMVDNSKKVTDLVSNLDKSNEQIHTALTCDISKSDQVNELFQNIKQNYPTFKAPNVIVNSAGILTQKSFLELKEEDFDRVIAVNLKGTFLVSQAAAKVLVENFKNVNISATDTYASIVNISSLSARHGFKSAPHYSASKAGVEGLTRAVAQALAKYKIRCNCVAPGYIDTEMAQRAPNYETAKNALAAQIPLGRMGKPTEVAQACLFLASDMSSYMTGESFLYHGGILS